MGPSLNKKCKLVSRCPINYNHIHKLATTDFQFPSEIVIYDIGFRKKRYLMMQEQFEYVLQKSEQHDDSNALNIDKTYHCCYRNESKLL